MIAFDKIRKRFPIGTRVRFKRAEERYPSFSVPAGTTGTVTEITDGMYSFDADAADMNGAQIIFRMRATGAADTFVVIKTAA